MGYLYKMPSDPRGSQKRPRSDEEDEALEPSVDPNDNNGFLPWWPSAGAPENPNPHCQEVWTLIATVLLVTVGFVMQNNRNRNHKK